MEVPSHSGHRLSIYKMCILQHVNSLRANCMCGDGGACVCEGEGGGGGGAVEGS